MQPAISLLQVFRDLASVPASYPVPDADQVAAGTIPSYETAKLCQYSESVSSIDSIGEEHVQAWVRWWRQQGFMKH